MNFGILICFSLHYNSFEDVYMLEKDIENLIATYPNEFFPSMNLKLVGQQIKLDGFYADIIFKINDMRKLIIEVKREILRREAIAQIIDYYGALREKETTTNIVLMIVANVIPKVRTIFLSEKLGIKFHEITITKIKRIASKYSYRFRDSEKPRLLTKYANTLYKLDSIVELGKHKVWIFQTNPERFDILNALDDESLKEDVWEVNKYKNDIRKGDIALIWMSGQDGGIYAVADIISNPELMYDSPESTRYWLSEVDRDQKKLRIKYRYRIKLINDPVLKYEIKNITQLENLKIFRQPQGTNFPVSRKEWFSISSLIKRRFI